MYWLSSENENIGMLLANNPVKNWLNLSISNPKPDLHNISAHTKFGEIPLYVLKLSPGNENTDGHTMWNHNTLPLSYGWTDVRQTDGLKDR